MKPIEKLLLLLFGLLVLIGCDSSEDAAQTDNPAKNIPEAIVKLPFLGEWHASSTVFDDNCLIIGQDSTFKFYQRGCTQYSYTEGKWSMSGRDILLSSYDSFRIGEHVVVEPPLNSNKRKKVVDSNANSELQSGHAVALVLDPFNNKLFFDRLGLRMIHDSLFARPDTGYLSKFGFHR